MNDPNDTENGISKLLRSRKFWTLLLDAVISLATYFGGRYLAPEAVGDLKFVIAIMQPIFVAVIAAIAVEDVAQARAYAEIETAKVRAK